MTPNITRAIEFLRKLDEGAEKAPWTIEGADPMDVEDASILGPLGVCEGCTGRLRLYHLADAALIAHVRNVLPQLVAVVEASSLRHAGERGNPLADALAALAAKLGERE